MNGHNRLEIKRLDNNRKTKEQLIQELEDLRRKIAELEISETARQKAEEALRKSEERFRLLLEQAPEAILVFDIDEERFILANAKAEKLFGCSPEELLKVGPQHFYAPIQPDGRPISESMKENIERVMAKEEVVTERAIHNAEGKDLICELHLVRLPFENRRLIRNSYFDITERKRAEEALKESEQKYRLLADNVTDVIFVLDMNLHYTYISPSVKILRGYEPAEVLKQQPFETLTPSSRDLALRTLSESMALEKSGHREPPLSRTLQLEVRRKDGTTVWTEVKLSFIRDENQRPQGNFSLA